jgi:undecaprenyl diphosphate synthase
MTAAHFSSASAQISLTSPSVEEHAGPVPAHIAIIMDGNGRWAARRKLPRAAGHRKGVQTVRNIAQACASRGVQYLTLFAFSSENWQRPAREVSFLMRLFAGVLRREIREMNAQGMRLRVVGDLSRFDAHLQQLVQEAEEKTAHNLGMTLTIAANYGGRWDILQAARHIARNKVEEQALLTEADFAQHLALAYAPEPDLFIRTGGEKRLSNFLLWQLAYTELYFTDIFWPDFDVAALEGALACYQQRERRFGRLSE